MVSIVLALFGRPTLTPGSSAISRVRASGW